MGPCISNKTSKKFECEIFTDNEWSSKGEDISAFLGTDTLPSSIRKKYSSATFDQVISRRVVQEIGATGSTYVLPRVCFRGKSWSPPVSPSKNTLATGKFFTASSVSTTSAYWTSFGDIMSYDGINKRVCNRYDVGLRILKAEIELGADPKGLITHGDRSCLMFAVLAEDFAFIQQLVRLGVDVNKTNAAGETALNLAVELKRKDIADYLLANGATV